MILTRYSITQLNSSIGCVAVVGIPFQNHLSVYILYCSTSRSSVDDICCIYEVQNIVFLIHRIAHVLFSKLCWTEISKGPHYLQTPSLQSSPSRQRHYCNFHYCFSPAPIFVARPIPPLMCPQTSEQRSKYSDQQRPTQLIRLRTLF